MLRYVEMIQSLGAIAIKKNYARAAGAAGAEAPAASFCCLGGPGSKFNELMPRWLGPGDQKFSAEHFPIWKFRAALLFVKATMSTFLPHPSRTSKNLRYIEFGTLVAHTFRGCPEIKNVQACGSSTQLSLQQRCLYMFLQTKLVKKAPDSKLQT